MNNDNRYDNLIVKYPKLYGRLKYFECDDGWYSIIESLSQKLEKINENFESDENYIQAAQVKEKFGGLRFYYSCENVENIDESVLKVVDFFIAEAEKQSKITCQFCGDIADFNSTSKTNWITTLCKQCKNTK